MNFENSNNATLTKAQLSWGNFGPHLSQNFVSYGLRIGLSAKKPKKFKATERTCFLLRYSFPSFKCPYSRAIFTRYSHYTFSYFKSIELEKAVLLTGGKTNKYYSEAENRRWQMSEMSSPYEKSREVSSLFWPKRVGTGT